MLTILFIAKFSMNFPIEYASPNKTKRLISESFDFEMLNKNS